MRGTTKPPSRPGTVVLDTLPGKGPWQLLACNTARFGEIVVAVSPDQPPRAYKDGRVIDLWEGFDR